MANNSFFTKEEIKLIDEDDFQLKEIINNNSIFIIEEFSEKKENFQEENSFDNSNNSQEKKDKLKIMTIIENGKIIKKKKDQC